MDRIALSPRLALVVICGCAISMLSFGARSSFGLFTDPISAAHGWSRDYFSIAMALQNICWGIGQPLAGAAADRYGPRVVMIAGGILYSGGIVLMTMSSQWWALNLSAGVLVGLGMGAASYITVLAAFGQIVPERLRSWALGLGTAAGSLGQFLLVPFTQVVTSSAGDWRVGAMTLAGLVALIPFLALAMKRPPDERSQRSGPSLGVALRQALANRSFLLLTTGFFVCGFQLAFITIHLPPYLADHGIGATIAAWAIGIVGFFNIGGAYVAGLLGATRSRKNLLALIYAGRGIAILAFILLPLSATSVLAFGAAMGILWLSTAPLTSGIVAAIFGTRYMATLFGIVFLGHQLGSFLGIWLGGLLFAKTGSYDLVWWLCVGLSFMAAIINWPIEERPLALRAAPEAA